MIKERTVVHFTASMKQMFEEMQPEQREHYGRAILAGIKQFEQLKLGSPEDAIAEATHRAVDEAIVTMFEKEPDVKVSCRRGCNHCCRILVQITEGEAQLLLPKLDPAALGTLHRQAEKATPDDWSSLPDDDKLCVFNKGGDCTVYAQRPMACRKYFVKSDPALCRQASNVYATMVQVIANPQAEMIATAAGTVFACEPMPRMLLKLIEDMK